MGATCAAARSGRARIPRARRSARCGPRGTTLWSRKRAARRCERARRRRRGSYARGQAVAAHQQPPWLLASLHRHCPGLGPHRDGGDVRRHASGESADAHAYPGRVGLLQSGNTPLAVHRYHDLRGRDISLVPFGCLNHSGVLLFWRLCDADANPARFATVLPPRERGMLRVASSDRLAVQRHRGRYQRDTLRGVDAYAYAHANPDADASNSDHAHAAALPPVAVLLPVSSPVDSAAAGRINGYLVQQRPLP
jgi:hypothetical protein